MVDSRKKVYSCIKKIKQTNRWKTNNEERQIKERQINEWMERKINGWTDSKRKVHSCMNKVSRQIKESLNTDKENK